MKNCQVSFFQHKIWFAAPIFQQITANHRKESNNEISSIEVN